jgi:hypothetical protein
MDQTVREEGVEMVTGADFSEVDKDLEKARAIAKTSEIVPKEKLKRKVGVERGPQKDWGTDNLKCPCSVCQKLRASEIER